MQHPYIGLKATRPASTNPRLPEVSGIIVAVGTETEELGDMNVLHFMGAILLLGDGNHKTVALGDLLVDPAEAAARVAPVERWQAVSLNGYSPSDASDPAPRGWEPVSAWEPAGNYEGHVLWRRPLCRVESQKAEV